MQESRDKKQDIGKMITRILADYTEKHPHRVFYSPFGGHFPFPHFSTDNRQQTTATNFPYLVQPMKRREFISNLSCLGALSVVAPGGLFYSQRAFSENYPKMKNSIQLIRNATLVIHYAG
jgi:hypothetical protein